MALDYANERWVRVYTRDTTTWKLLTWQARAVLMFLIRKVDRAGVLDVGDDGVAGLAAVLEIPEEVAADAIDQLVRRGVVVTNRDAYVLPAFIEAQETPSSDAQRKRDSREKRRSRVIESQNVTDKAQNVTDSHVRSQAVTNGHSETRQDKTRILVAHGATPDLFDSTQQPAEPDAATTLATTCVGILRAEAGRNYEASAQVTVELARKLAKRRVTAEQVRSVVSAKVAEWLHDPKMSPYLRPSTLLAPGKFFAYLDDLNAGRGSTTSPQRWRMPEV